MLDFSNFSDQYPDPDKGQVMRIIEEVKIHVIKLHNLSSEAGKTNILPVKRSSHSGEVLAAYVQAYWYVHQHVIPTLQNLLPPQFTDLIAHELSNWIDKIKISQSP